MDIYGKDIKGRILVKRWTQTSKRRQMKALFKPHPISGCRFLLMTSSAVLLVLAGIGREVLPNRKLYLRSVIRGLFPSISACLSGRPFVFFCQYNCWVFVRYLTLGQLNSTLSCAWRGPFSGEELMNRILSVISVTISQFVGCGFYIGLTAPALRDYFVNIGMASSRQLFFDRGARVFSSRGAVRGANASQRRGADWRHFLSVSRRNHSRRQSYH